MTEATPPATRADARPTSSAVSASTPTSTPAPARTDDPAARVVTAFLDGLRRLDADAVLALLAEDVVYQNVSLPAAHGRDAVGRQLRLLTRYCTGFEAINHRMVSDGHTVLTERTDVIEFGRVRSEFWVCGTFEISGGKIVLWRDYFDWANIVAGVAKGTGKALVSLVRDLRR